ncbi:MAG: hypothetical protein ACREMP_02635 [Candidatus Tyrphobacter sp.]
MAAHRVGVLFEGMILAMLLEPLARAQGVLGGYGTTCIAQSIAANDEHGFGALVAAALERRRG